MKKVARLIKQLGPDVSFSSEHWISSDRIKRLGGGTKLLDIVRLTSSGSTGKENLPIFMDTNVANNGLLDISRVLNGSVGERTSHKKVIAEGCVIMSRLRPYLRQIAYIPIGFFKEMKCTDVLCSTEFYVFEPNEKNQSIAFLVPWLLSSEPQDIFQQATTGGHHPRFDKDLLTELSVPDSFLKDRLQTSREVETLSLQYIKTQLGMRRLVQTSSS